MTGEPKKIEHDPPIPKPPQFVFAEPGPTNPKSNDNPGMVANVMKLASGRTVPPVRSSKVPVLPTAGVPRALVSVVPELTTKVPVVAIGWWRPIDEN
jgi:hypothetical protein